MRKLVVAVVAVHLEGQGWSWVGGSGERRFFSFLCEVSEILFCLVFQAWLG